MIKLLGFFMLSGGLILWMIGGNLIVARSFKRRALPLETGFQPFGMRRAKLNVKEVLALFALMVLCLGLLVFGGTLMNQ